MKKALVVYCCLCPLLLAAAGSHALSLGEGLSLLSRAGREIAISAGEEDVARSAPLIAGAAKKPTVDLYSRETLLAYQPRTVVNSQSFPVANSESFAAGFRVRQLLYDFGRTDAAVRAALIDADTRRIDTSLTRNRSALKFILAYVRLLRAGRLLDLQRLEVTRFEAHRHDTRALFDAGTVTENAVLEAEVRLADAVQRRIQAENSRALAAAQVNSQLLLPLAQPVAEQEIAEPAAGEAERSLDRALALAERGRLEFAGARGRISAAEARLAAVDAEYYPQLYLAGGYDFAQNDYTVHEGNWTLQAVLDLNIYSGGVTQEKSRQRERELRLLERRREQLLDAVLLEAQEGFLALQTSRSRVAATEKAVEQARENLRLQQLRYVEGVGTGTEVLDAVSLATTAEQNYLNARYDVTEARARLAYAVGEDLVASWGGGARSADKGGEHE